MLQGRHLPCFTKILRDKRFREVLTREYPLIHRQDYKVLKIKATSFKQTHNLQSPQRLTFKSHLGGTNKSIQQEAECGDIDSVARHQIGIVEHLAQLSQRIAIAFNKSTLYIYWILLFIIVSLARVCTNLLLHLLLTLQHIVSKLNHALQIVAHLFCREFLHHTE